MPFPHAELPNEAARRTKCWGLARNLYTRWHSMHGAAGSLGAWDDLDEWDKGYWYGVAEYVLDNFTEKGAPDGT